MATLNRFPLFGLWNRVAATHLGYAEDEAMCIGHAVAVLYAIRAKGGGKAKSHSKSSKTIPAGDTAQALATEDVRFGGDSLPCEFDVEGRVLRCLVGVQAPKDAAQTPDSYRSAVQEKIPPEHLAALSDAMAALLATYQEKELLGSLLYDIYDEWKQGCKAGRRVDLDLLVKWLGDRARTRQGA